ncbi:LamG-like jellyroll fold domain-containing protein [Wenjunlia tyrosinilytica]|nr:LamG-like jellyroll fold domain-containing protein [Wenjunlia tyrosinilytica]
MRRTGMIAVAAITLATAPTVGSAAHAAEPAAAPTVAFTSNALSTWQTDGIVWTLAQHAGTVFAGGTFAHVRPPGSPSGSNEQTATNFAAFDAATGSPTSCELSFTLGGGGTATVRSLDVSPDGKTLYAGGYFSAVNGTSVNSLAAIDIDTCTPVSGFRPAVSATVRAIQSTDDTVYFGGDFTTVGGQARQRLAAVSTSGAVKSWAPTAEKSVRALGLSPGKDKVIVGGDFFTVNGADSHALAVVDAGTGDNYRTYPLGFIEQNSVVKDITTDATGFYTGNEGTGGGVFDGRIAVDFSTYDQRWRDTCLGATQAVAVHHGVLYSGSHAHDCSSMGEYPDGRRQHLLAQSTQDPELLPWFPDTNDGIGEQIGPRDIVVSGDGSSDYLWISGEFTTVNGTAQQGLTRFGQGPDLTAPTIPVASASSFEAGKAQVRWRASTDTDDGTLTYKVYRDGGSTPVWTGTADSRWWSRPQVSFTDSGLTPGSTHSYRVAASDGPNTSALSAAASVQVATTTSAYPSRVLADGAKLYWRYDEASGNFAGDNSSGDDNGLYVGGLTRRVAPGAITGDSSPGLGTDGSTGYVYTERRHDRPSAFTAETWFKTTSTTGGKLIGFGDGQTRTSGSYDKHVYMTNGGRLVFGVWNGHPDTLTTANAYNDGQWHHVAASQGSGGMALYVDGVRVGRNSVADSQDYSGFWRVGGDNLNGWPNQPTSAFFGGTLDETAVYPTALTSTQIADHYRLSGRTPDVPNPPSDAYGQAVFNDGPDSYWRLGEASGTTAQDASGNSAKADYSSGATLGAAGAIKGTSDHAVGLDGTTNGLVSASDTSSVGSAYSAELWFKTNTTTGGKLIGFGGNKTGYSSNYDKHVYMSDSGRLVFGVWNGRADVITTAGSYNDNAWHHVVATQGSGGMALYVDGAEAGTNPVSTHQPYSGYWRVGGDNLNGWPNQPSSAFFKGTVDEAAVYSTRLSAIRIAAHYALGNSTADTQAPSTPTGLSADATGGDVALSWTASTDNVGVTAYDVHRSATSGFTPSAATKIATTTSPGYTDSGRPPGAWHYRVVARDAEDNASDPSAQASATVVADPVSLTVVPSADAYVNQNAASTNYGSTGSLASRGTPGYVSYLRFPVPAAPPGTEVKAARLRISTTSETFAGSADPHTVRVAGNGWTESTVNWTNRPSATGALLGTLTGATQPSTAYSVELDAAQVQALLDGDATFAVAGTGTDNLWFGSNGAAAASRPSLVIDFGPES